MVCPECGFGSRVYDSRHDAKNNEVRRYRICRRPGCNRTWPTVERRCEMRRVEVVENAEDYLGLK